MSASDRIYTFKHVDDSATIYPAVCCAEVFEYKDYATGKISVKGRFCTAPDSCTTLQWPFLMESEGYMTRTEVKQQRSAIKRELKQWLKANSIVLTEPLRDE